MGQRLLEMDPRSTACVTVALWIIQKVKHGKLLWWIIENVRGIRKRRRGDSESFADWFVREMMSAMPAGWKVDAVEFNSAHCDRPQYRPPMCRTPASRHHSLSGPDGFCSGFPRSEPDATSVRARAPGSVPTGGGRRQ
eukprot:780450-Pyramimonas_sp.AAC.1